MSELNKYTMRTNIEILESLSVNHKKLKEDKPLLLFNILKAMDIARTEQLTIPAVVGRSEQFYCFDEKNKRIDRCTEQCSTCKELKLMQ